MELVNRADEQRVVLRYEVTTRRVMNLLQDRAAAYLCAACVGSLLGVPQKRAHEAALRLEGAGTFRRRYARCSRCGKTRVVVQALASAQDPGSGAVQDAPPATPRDSSPRRDPGRRGALDAMRSSRRRRVHGTAVVDLLRSRPSERLCATCIAVIVAVTREKAHRLLVTLEALPGFQRRYAICSSCCNMRIVTQALQ